MWSDKVCYQLPFGHLISVCISLFHVDTGSPDSRYIRVETCMFMIKLPQYSSLDNMLEKLRYAIHYREDPLSGWAGCISNSHILSQHMVMPKNLLNPAFKKGKKRIGVEVRMESEPWSGAVRPEDSTNKMLPHWCKLSFCKFPFLLMD